MRDKGSRLVTYTLAVGVVERLQLYNVWVADNTHDLKLTVLLRSEACFTQYADRLCSYLESFVLQNTLDGGVLSIGRNLCLKYDSKGAIANYFALSVLHVTNFTSDAILDSFTNNLCRVVSNELLGSFMIQLSLPPMRRLVNADGRLLEDILAGSSIYRSRSRSSFGQRNLLLGAVVCGWFCFDSTVN
jgi:hypothetical protein